MKGQAHNWMDRELAPPVIARKYIPTMRNRRPRTSPPEP
jgi:hypothetical protein